MKKAYLTVVLTLTCLLGLGMSARAEQGSTVAVAVPFEFVAGSKTMPAGTYRISSPFPTVDQSLIIRGYDGGVFLLPISVDRVPAEHTKLSFRQVGDKYFLSKIETSAGIYTIRTPRVMTKLAQVKANGTGAASSGN